VDEITCRPMAPQPNRRGGKCWPSTSNVTPGVSRETAEALTANEGRGARGFGDQRKSRSRAQSRP
jgi:hypothetical protein